MPTVPARAAARLRARSRTPKETARAQAGTHTDRARASASARRPAASAHRGTNSRRSPIRSRTGARLAPVHRRRGTRHRRRRAHRRVRRAAGSVPLRATGGRGTRSTTSATPPGRRSISTPMITSPTIASVFTTYSDSTVSARWMKVGLGPAKTLTHTEAIGMASSRPRTSAAASSALTGRREPSAYPSMGNQRRSSSQPGTGCGRRPIRWLGMTSISGGSSAGALSAGAGRGRRAGFHGDAFTALDGVGRRLARVSAANHAETTRPPQATAMHGPCARIPLVSPGSPTSGLLRCSPTLSSRARALQD